MRHFKYNGWACKDMCRYYCTNLLWWVSFIDFSHSLAWSESVSALFWHKTRDYSLVLSYTDSQLGTVLIYDSLLHTAYRLLLQIWAGPNVHVAAITVFLELFFVYTGAMVTEHLRKSILSGLHVLHNTSVSHLTQWSALYLQGEETQDIPEAQWKSVLTMITIVIMMVL